MELFTMEPFFTAFIRPGEGANVGLVRTSEGMVLIDTASSPDEIKVLLDAVAVRPDEIRLVINTHFHTDHTWGNQLFSCPILAHCLCRDKMQSNLHGEWSPAEFQAYIAELSKSDPIKAGEFRQLISNLQVKLPDQVFDDRFDVDLGGLQLQVIHVGGHTPDASIIWMPEKRLLYASDLIFQGRYPYIFDADVPAWITALKRLLEFDAEVIIPGHGVRCTALDITRLSDYLQQTWQLAGEHVRQGHSVEEACADPMFPAFAEGKKEKLHPANIRYMFTKITEMTST